MIVKADVHMLTTIDNPTNPFDNFEEWFAFDDAKGYNCCGNLAKYFVDSKLMSQREELEEHERAIQEVIDRDNLGIYIKVKATDRIIPISVPILAEK